MATAERRSISTAMADVVEVERRVEKKTVLLTIDLEDYRRQELRDHLRNDEPPHPREVTKQTLKLLDLLDNCKAQGTFFCVGRLAGELDTAVWNRIDQRHEIGCHGHEHMRVDRLGPRRFREDLCSAKAALEDRTQRHVISFRAPYFSSESCDPWFGRALAETGFRVDSSMRINRPPPDFRGTIPLQGSGGAVTSIPFLSIGAGRKRMTIIGGTYFRLFPLGLICSLIGIAERRGFIPMIYLHPYDMDESAAPLGYPLPGWLRERAGDRIRRVGRARVADKVQLLGQLFRFESIKVALGM